jgi:hypothetical protein
MFNSAMVETGRNECQCNATRRLVVRGALAGTAGRFVCGIKGLWAEFAAEYEHLVPPGWCSMAATAQALILGTLPTLPTRCAARRFPN